MILMSDQEQMFFLWLLICNLDSIIFFYFSLHELIRVSEHEVMLEKIHSWLKGDVGISKCNACCLLFVIIIIRNNNNKDAQA